MASQELSSPVVLICIQNPDFINVTVTHIHSHFSQFGTIQKILIFERNKPVWKALVEYETIIQAEMAMQVSKSVMHGLSVLIFQSNRKNLEFQARNQYARYYKDQPALSLVSQSLILANKNPIQQQKQVQSTILPQVRSTQKPQEVSMLSTQFTQFNFNDDADKVSDYGDDEDESKEGFLEQFEKVVNKNLDCLKSFSDFKDTFQSQQLQLPVPVKETKIFQSEILEQKKLITRVVYINWFDPKKTTMNMVYNIFSTFGNILKMIYFRTKCNVLIEYSTEVSVKFLLTNFNDTNPTLFGQKLKVYPSNYEQIFFKGEPGTLPKDTDEEEYYIGNEQSFRYQNNNFKYLVAPSCQIMLTNLKKEFCEEGLILEAFYKFGQIESLKLLCEEKNKNKCLIRFTDIDSAIQALAIMHNYNYNNRKIQIFFSKTKC